MKITQPEHGSPVIPGKVQMDPPTKGIVNLTDSEIIVFDYFLSVLKETLGNRVSNDWSLPDTLTEPQKKEFCEAFNHFGSKHDIPPLREDGMTFDWLVVIFLQERLRGL